MTKVTHEELLKVLDYDKVTGIFTWKVSIRPGVHSGDIAGNLMCQTRYIQIGLYHKRYYGHILAWFYVTKEWPSKKIDHKDTNRSNNCFDNLRLATNSQNIVNKLKPSNNTSGYKGAMFDKKCKRWRAYIGRDHLGMCDTAEQAGRLYDEAAKIRYGEYANLNFPEDSTI